MASLLYSFRGYSPLGPASSKQKASWVIRLLAPGILIISTVLYLGRSIFPGSISYPVSVSRAPTTPRDGGKASSLIFVKISKPQRWTEYSGNPVLPDEAHTKDTGTIFDLVLWEENMTSNGIPADLYFRNPDAQSVETALTWRMWSSWRPSYGIAYSTSVDGRNWDQNLQMSLGRNQSGWEDTVNRPFVRKVATGKYAMWYTGQVEGVVGGRIGYAESTDGINFHRTQEGAVLVPTLLWEKEAVMTPTIIDLPNDVLRMYYAAGEAYEPDAIGVAHSYDGGLTWVKHGNPIFGPDRTSGEVGTWWDSYKVTSPHVIRDDDGYFYLFYAGFRNVDYSSIGFARSRDGLTNWERHVGNPIVDIRQDRWNCNAVYKPFVGWSETQQEWLLWYNGRCGFDNGSERIGLSTLKAKTFTGFVKRG